ncbi:uncharacterized protein LOC144643685 [Oculina patagonica]
MLSASFHSGCRAGSLTTLRKRGQAEELMAEVDSPPPVRPIMTLGQLSFVKDAEGQLHLILNLVKEKQDMRFTDGHFALHRWKRAPPIVQQPSAFSLLLLGVPFSCLQKRRLTRQIFS